MRAGSRRQLRNPGVAWRKAEPGFRCVRAETAAAFAFRVRRETGRRSLDTSDLSGKVSTAVEWVMRSRDSADRTAQADPWVPEVSPVPHAASSWTRPG